MSRQDANAAFALTSFLYGGNAAYIEDLYGRYQHDPNSVDAEWQTFFQSLKDDEQAVAQVAQRRLVEAAELAAAQSGELVSALDGDWARGREDGRRQDQGQGADGRRRALLERRAAGDARLGARADADPRLSHARPSSTPTSIRSASSRRRTTRSSIRAATASPRPTSIARSSSTRCSAWNSRRMREIVAILRRTYCQTLGVEFMHISNPAQKAGSRSASKGRTRRSPFTREGKRAILNKLVEAGRLREVLDAASITGTKRFGLDGGEVDDPGARADHQARRQRSA